MNKKGFTLLEALLVIAVIGLFLTFVISAIFSGIKTKHRICDEYNNCYITDSSVINDGCVTFDNKTICGNFIREKFED